MVLNRCVSEHIQGETIPAEVNQLQLVLGMMPLILPSAPLPGHPLIDSVALDFLWIEILIFPSSHYSLKNVRCNTTRVKRCVTMPVHYL